MVEGTVARSRKSVEPTRPFLKWAGGKRRLLDQLRPYYPQQFGRYHEPFVGSAAVFFDLVPQRASLADTNERLIRTYRGIRDDVEDVISLLASYPHDKEFFLQMRKANIDEQADVQVAAWFIYLNKTAFNGLYRVNRGNRFNVPFGAYARPAICVPDLLRTCGRRLKNVRLEVADFATTARRARRGDLVYFDPPYVPLSATSSFTSYTRHGFDMAAQRRLHDVTVELKARGVHVLLSNSSAPAVYEIYGDGFECIEVTARRAISASHRGRGIVKELLIR